MKTQRFICVLVLFFIAFVQTLSAQTDVAEVYTDFDGFWESSSLIEPDNSHNLLGFEVGGTVYSTGVNDAILTSNSVTFTPGNWRALPISWLDPKCGIGGFYLIMLGQLVDGVNNGGSSPPPFDLVDGCVTGETLASFLTRGDRGLDLGSGVANPPSDLVLSFPFSAGGITEGNIDDGIPDILITQMAGPADTDVFKIVDGSGGIVGNEVTIVQSDTAPVATYRVDFYRRTGTIVDIGAPSANDQREIRMVALELKDFGLNSSNFNDADALVWEPSGSSDPAFFAFNEPTVDVDPSAGAPTKLSITTQPPATYPYAQPLGSNIQVRAEDASGNPIEQSGNTISVAIASGNGTLSGTLSETTNASGVATFDDLSITGTGTQSLIFSFGSLDPATSNNLTPDFITWTGNSSSDWNTASNWEPQQVPVSTDDVVIPNAGNQPAFGADSEVSNLFVNSGSTLTLADGDALTVTGTIDDSGSITVASGALFNNQGGSSPTLVMKRNLEGVEGWRYLTAPTGTTLQTLLGPIWTQGVTTGGDTDFGTPNVYRWGNVTGNDRGEWVPVTDLSQPAITGGEGFLVYVYADPDFDGPETNGFPYELSATGQEFAATVSQTTNSADNTSWSLLGNPFATAIDFAALQSGNAITDAVYVWTPDDTGNTDETDFNSGSWATFTIGSGAEAGDLSDGLIAPFQAFFVQNDGASSVGIDFTNSTKSTGSATTFLFKKQQIPTVRLEVEGSGMKDSAWLTFTENGADHAKTEGDAWELAPMSENYLSLASRKSDGSIFDIGHFSAAADLPKQIPVVVDATQPGEYKLQATDINNFMGNGSLLFKDLERDVTVPIDQDFSYRFDIEKASKISVPSDPFEILNQPFKKENSNSEVRFVIVVNSQLGELSNPDEIPDQIGLKQNFPNPFNPTTQITYELPQNSNVRLEVFDMNGRQVATLVNESVSAGTHIVSFNASDLSSGVYMYRLQAGSTVLSRKLTLIK